MRYMWPEHLQVGCPWCLGWVDSWTIVRAHLRTRQLHKPCVTRDYTLLSRIRYHCPKTAASACEYSYGIGSCSWVSSNPCTCTCRSTWLPLLSGYFTNLCSGLWMSEIAWRCLYLDMYGTYVSGSIIHPWHSRRYSYVHVHCRWALVSVQSKDRLPFPTVRYIVVWYGGRYRIVSNIGAPQK